VADVEVTRAGQSVAVSAGDRIVILLSEPSAGTGFEWDVATLPDFLEVEGSSLDPAHGAVPGAAATRRMVLRALGPGTANVELALRRAWERDRPPAERFDVAVTAR
jgi:predicted secreted protein